MKIMQGGYYDLLLFTGLFVTGLSVFSILLYEGHYEILLFYFQLAVSIGLFLISWGTLFLFTLNMLRSAAASARTAGVYFGLSVVRATVLFLLGLNLSGLWAAIVFVSEIVVVSVGMSYLHLLNRKEGVLSGLVVSVAIITFLLIIYTVLGP